MARRFIFTKEQILEAIDDSSKTKIAFDGTNASEMGNNAQSEYNDALRAGLKPNAIQMDGKSTMNNATDKDEVKVSFDTKNGSLKDSVTNTVQNAVNNGLDINKLNVVGNAEDIATNESVKRYSKKQLKEMHVKKLIENCEVMTKKSIREKVYEERFREAVKSSVMEALSEISPDLLFRASRKASDLDRTNQANSFSRYGERQFGDNLGIRIMPNSVFYTSTENEECVLTRVSLTIGNTVYHITNPQDEIPYYAKVWDKRAARAIAKWCNANVEADEDVLRKLSDWHTWCQL